MGFRGTDTLNEPDSNGQVKKDDVTYDYPWIFRYKDSKVVRNEYRDSYTEQFVFYRDYKSPNSQIELKPGQHFYVKMGYKIYEDEVYDWDKSSDWASDFPTWAEGKPYSHWTL